MQRFQQILVPVDAAADADPTRPETAQTGWLPAEMCLERAWRAARRQPAETFDDLGELTPSRSPVTRGIRDHWIRFDQA